MVECSWAQIKHKTDRIRLRTGTSFFLIGRAKRARHENDNVRDQMREAGKAFSSSRAAALVSRAYTLLARSESSLYRTGIRNHLVRWKYNLRRERGAPHPSSIGLQHSDGVRLHFCFRRALLPSPTYKQNNDDNEKNGTKDRRDNPPLDRRRGDGGNYFGGRCWYNYRFRCGKNL